MGKTKKTHKKAFQGLSKRTRLFVLPLMIFISLGAIILAVLTILVMPRVNPGAQRGVGADGFQAYVEAQSDMGIGNVVDKAVVTKALSGEAKSVDDVQVSKVMNLNGTRGQTATFPFTRMDGAQASVYVDLMFFKNQETLDTANITAATIKINAIHGHPAYLMHAQTIGSDREYRLMVVNGLQAYKFVMTQPVGDIKINEVTALAIMQKIAESAKFL
jgi:hypothetical protein